MNIEKSIKKGKKGKFYVYILKMNDDSLYTGITNNLIKRLDKHITGKGSKYVRSRLPIKEMAYNVKPITKSEALKLEYRIKQFPKNEKMNKLKEIL